MSIAQLRAFHVVAMAGGFSQAARETAISQSALSGQVRALEAASGVSLFERKQRGVALTAQGRTLLDITSRLFEAENEANSFLREKSRVTGGHLRISADGAILALPILMGLRESRPELTFALHVDNSYRVLEHILDYRADVGITARRPEDPRIHAHYFCSMTVGLCVAAAHELASRRQVTMAQLQGLPFVMREHGSLTREVFERNLTAHGVTVGTILEISTREGVREAVANGLGCGVVAGQEFGHDSRLRFIPIVDAHEAIAEFAVCLAERKHLPLVRAFFDQAQIWADARKPQAVPMPGA